MFFLKPSSVTADMAARQGSFVSVYIKLQQHGRVKLQHHGRTTHCPPSMPKCATCSMCRCSATEDHLASDWHKYNLKVTTEGKTPMAKDLYENFEKMRIQSGGTTASAATSTPAPVTGNVKNVNSWHWEEKNVFAWAKKRLDELLKAAVITVEGNGKITITAVKDIEGDAYLNNRKGKIRYGYEFKLKMEWAGEIRDGDGEVVVKCTGKSSVTEIDDTVDDDEYEDQIHVSRDKDEKGSDVIFTVMKKRGRVVIADQIRKLVAELKQIKQDTILS